MTIGFEASAGAEQFDVGRIMEAVTAAVTAQALAAGEQNPAVIEGWARARLAEVRAQLEGFLAANTQRAADARAQMQRADIGNRAAVHGAAEAEEEEEE